MSTKRVEKLERMDRGALYRMVWHLLAIAAVAAVLWSPSLPALAQGPTDSRKQTANRPWMNRALPPDKRADLAVAAMTLDEKVTLVHGFDVWGSPPPPQWLGGAGFAPGIPRLGIPDVQSTDGRSGVGRAGSRGRYATALPCALAPGGNLGRDAGQRLRQASRKRVPRLGFPHLAGRHGEPRPRAAQRPELRVLRRRPDPDREDDCSRAEGYAGRRGGRQYQPICPERSGDGPHGIQRGHGQADHAGDRPLGVRDRHQRIGGRDGDGGLQPSQRPLRV